MKNLKIEIKWAIIFTIMMLTWMLMERLMGFHSENIEQHAIATNFVAIPAIAIYVFALLDKRKNYYGGYMNYKQGFVAGFFITLFVTILTPLVQYLTSTFITPDYFPNMIEYTVSKNIMTREQAEANFNLGTYLWQATAGAFIMGLITSAIVAFFTKKSAPFAHASY